MCNMKVIQEQSRGLWWSDDNDPRLGVPCRVLIVTRYWRDECSDHGRKWLSAPLSGLQRDPVKNGLGSQLPNVLWPPGASLTPPLYRHRSQARNKTGMVNGDPCAEEARWVQGCWTVFPSAKALPVAKPLFLKVKLAAISWPPLLNTEQWPN